MSTRAMLGVMGLAAGLMVSAAEVEAAKIVIDLGGGTSGVVNNAATGDNSAIITYNHYEVGAPTTPVFTDLLDVTGASTGIGFTRVGGAIGSNNTGPATLSGAAAAIFPNAVGLTFGFVQVIGMSHEYTISNLDSNTYYTFDILSGRAAGTNRTTEFTVTGSNSGNGTVNSAQNNSLLVHIENIIPSNDGTITLRFGAAEPTESGGDFGYINGVQITTSPIPEPASLGTLGAGAAMLVIRRRRRNSGV
jgi:hypothetical protein